MRSEISSASSSACEMKMTETPRAFRSRTRSKKYFFSSGVRLAVGSSKMMTLALCSTARAISTICFLAAPSRPTVAVGSTSKLQRLQELLRGDVDAAQPVEELLLPEEEVLRHRHGRHQAGLLEDHGDAEIARLAAASAARPRAPSTSIVPEVSVDDAGHHLGQGRLAGAVLADQRVDLAAAEVRNRRPRWRARRQYLCRLAQLEDRCRSWRASSSARRRRAAVAAARRRPLASTTECAVASRPRRRCRGCLPSTRLCSE